LKIFRSKKLVVLVNISKTTQRTTRFHEITGKEPAVLWAVI
jgi:hypothetical protein